MSSSILSHSHMRKVAISYINAATSPRDKANRIFRTRVILDYLHHRQLRQALRRNGGFWGENISEYIDPVHSAASSLGKLGGSVKSEAKSTSARANGRKGGRPKSTQSIDMEDI